MMQQVQAALPALNGEGTNADAPDPLEEQVEHDERKLEPKVESLEDPLVVSSQLRSRSLAKWKQRMSGENLFSPADSDCSNPLLLQSVLMLEQVDLQLESDEFRGTA